MSVDDVWCATRRGDLEKVREFIERDGIPKVEDEYDSQSLLTVACEAGHIEVVRFLMENGDYLFGLYAPCAFAALDNGHIEVLRVLCEFELDSDAREYSKHGISLLETVVILKQREAMLLFIEYGAEIKYSWWGPDEDEFGYDTYLSYDPDETTDETTLEMAAFAGRPDLIEFFLDVGAKVYEQRAESYLKLAREKEPLRLEFEEKQREQRAIKRKNELFKEIKDGHSSISEALKAHVDANDADEDGNNMLFNFLKQKQLLNKENLADLQQLVTLTDLAHKNKNGESAWEMADRHGQIHAMFYLMEQAKIPITPQKRFFSNCRLVIRWVLIAIKWISIGLACVLVAAIILVIAIPVLMVLLLGHAIGKLKPNKTPTK